MKPNTYDANPALRPTQLVDAVMTTVYRPTAGRPLVMTSSEVPAVRPDATISVARSTTRAA